ncbi:MAG TPA: M20/M25/M40 family metallo-hydrolase [Gemmatimonadaceae bacterium]|nr:M20/M25/M40 family metallo-hydrolase [Gemmatimonadaceae bacterium]
MTARRAVFLLLLAGATPAFAQGGAGRLDGYSAEATARQRALEADAIRRPDSATSRAHAVALTREPHVAGTDAQARTRDYVIARMRAWGLETEVRTYEVWLPHATAVSVWRVAPDPRELALDEPPVAEDSATALPQYPTVNGYSASGDVRGEVVFVNYGLIEDYARLDSIGVSVAGRIAIARYGRSFRGIKAREAERRGAIALLLYSDPRDDGFERGPVYPDGPMRPAFAVQRGSVMNGAGDPSTPGWPSVSGARRLPIDSMAVPRIPVVPIGYGNAAELLRGVRGASVPDDWQGGLPFRYHIGPGPVVARVRVETDAATRGFKPIWNTLGVVWGTDRPDELVVIGAHRDAWGPGAVDNVSGTVSVLEAARAVAEQVRAGNRPRRTIIFATWDAEEWGLIGSTEYVEEDSLRLLRGAVAYLNQDVAAMGTAFGAGGSPSLRSTVRDVVRGIPSPDGDGTIYDAWRRRTGVAPGVEPPMGDPGGGSDFAGFYNHLGIPHGDWGFGAPWGVYHSQYDTHHWMTEFGDHDFRHHAAAARIGAAMVLRLANADILPYDYVEFARTMRDNVAAIERALDGRRWSLSAAPLAEAIGRMEREASAFAAARDASLAGAAPPADVRDRVNGALLRVERALTRPEGLRGRPWYRTLIYAADSDNGYATVIFPSVAEAIRAGDADLTRTEVADLAARFDAATAALTAARQALSGRAVGSGSSR